MISITNDDDRELCVVVDVLLPPTEIDGMGGSSSALGLNFPFR